MALSTARVRSRTPSLERIFETWFFTVPSDKSSASAISRLEYPPVINLRISDSRSVRASSGFGSARCEVGFNSRMSRTVSAGLNRVTPMANRLGQKFQCNVLHYFRLADYSPNGRFPMTHKQLCSAHRLCRFGWLDVVVHAEEVCRVVFVLQGSQSIVVRAVGGSREGVSFVRDVVDIRAGHKVRPHRFPILPCPLDVLF